MTHGSLFSGIGGFDLAAEWMGWENLFHCEWNEFGQKVLNYYFPNAESFTDITKTDFTKYANRIDVLTGGFPCQPYSLAGKRLGKEDDRHLWPEMLRVIREVKPRWVIGENVLGLVNWNGGLVFHEVQTDLEAQGYEVFPYVLNAASIGAPHKRDRVWFVAYTNNKGRSTRFRKVQKENGEISERNYNAKSCDTNQLNNVTNTKQQRLQGCTDAREISSEKTIMGKKGNKSTIEFTTISKKSDVANTDGIRLRGKSNRLRKSRLIGKNDKRNNWQTFPTVSPLCNGDDGLSDRLDTITFSKWRNESIKAGGNAVVPQLVLQIFKAIQQYNDIAN